MIILTEIISKIIYSANYMVRNQEEFLKIYLKPELVDSFEAFNGDEIKDMVVRFINREYLAL